MKNWRLSEVWEDAETTGIFAALEQIATDPALPWASDDYGMTSAALDMAYYLNHSGDKIVSPLIRKKAVDGVLPSQAKSEIAAFVWALYGVYWGKEWATLAAQYDPIENYSMLEQMTNDQTVTDYGRTETRTDNLSHGKTGTETRAPNTTATETPNRTQTTQNNINAFNSSQSVPTGDSTVTDGGTSTTSVTGTDTVTYNTTDSNTGTETNAQSGRDTQTRNYRLTRSGNIGVTTSQQMLQSERDLWRWNFFEEVVFPDIDRVLTIPIY